MVQISRSSHWRCSIKKGALKNFAVLTEKHLCWSLFLIKLQAWRHATLLNETPTQVFSWEYCEIFKNIYFEEHLQTAAPDILVNSILQRDSVKICDRNNLLVFEYHFFHKFSSNLSKVYCLRLLFSCSSRIHTLYCGCHTRKSCSYHRQ